MKLTGRFGKGAPQEACRPHVAGMQSAQQIAVGNWDLLEAALDLANIALWDWDVQRDRIGGTRLLYEILRIQPGEMGYSVERMLRERVHPAHRQYVEEGLAEARRVGFIDRFKYKIVCPDGQERWILIKGRYCQDGTRAVGILQDCSSTQQAELSLHEDLEFMNRILDAMPNPVFYKDHEGIYRYCNQSFARMMGTRKEYLMEHTVAEMAPRDLYEMYQRMDQELLANGGSQQYDYPIQMGRGEKRTVRFNKALCADPFGRVSGIVGVITDVEDLKEQLLRQERLSHMKDAMLEISQAVIGMPDLKSLLDLILAKALDTVPYADVGAVLTLGPDGYLRVMTSRGYVEEQVPDFRLKVEETYTYMASRGQIDRPVIINDIPKFLKDGSPPPMDNSDGRAVLSSLSAPVHLEGSPLILINLDSYSDQVFQQADLEMMGYFCSQVELALINQQLHQETLRLSRTDGLTGLYNRGYIEQVLEGYLRRTGDFSQPFALVLLDIDRMKAFNERYGHSAGDDRLRRFGAGLRNRLEEEDLMGRYGGDEFVAVLFGRSAKEAEVLLADFRETASEESFSYGIAEFPADGRTYAELVVWADRRKTDNKKMKRGSSRAGDENQ